MIKRLEKSLADYLIAQGLVRAPVTSGNKPVIFVNPTEGAPAPSDLKGSAIADVTLTIQTNGGSATNPFFGFIDRPDILLIYRAKPGKEKDLIDFANSVDDKLDDQRAFEMGSLRTELSTRISQLQLVSISDKGEGNIYTSSYSFLIRKENLK